jgi:2-oxoglutarate ferredoxin oxidoreductase subunit alpha
MLDLTIRAFNVAEWLRTPVVVMADAFVGHMRETVSVPERIEIVERVIPAEGTDPLTIRGFLDEDVAPMPVFGRGFKVHVTGSCHDEYGQRNVVDAEALDNFVRKLSGKIRKRRHDLMLTSSEGVRAMRVEVAIVGYGSTARVAQATARMAREEGLPVGSFKMTTLWPFPEKEIEELAEQVGVMVVLENNLGQMVHYIQAAAKGRADVIFVPPETLGTLHHPGYVLQRVKEAL